MHSHYGLMHKNWLVIEFTPKSRHHVLNQSFNCQQLKYGRAYLAWLTIIFKTNGFVQHVFWLRNTRNLNKIAVSVYTPKKTWWCWAASTRPPFHIQGFLSSLSPVALNNSFLLNCIFSSWIIIGCNNSDEENMLYLQIAGQATFQLMPSLACYGLRQGKCMYTNIFSMSLRLIGKVVGSNRSRGPVD